jgi:hypothetical protein
MSNKTVFDYARIAVQAEQRILDLLTEPKRRDSLSECSEEGSKHCVRPHPDPNSSG